MQGGLPSVRLPDGSLNRATGAAGNDVFRGDRLPADMVGDYFYGEAVARIVRRLRPVKTEGLTQLRNVYPLSEFIRSTDPLFRPVDMTTAPDGTMYITDMYRGIIQEAQWSGRGTYLRQKIEQYQLDKVVRHGRIWRLTYDGMERDTTQPRMLNETPAQLVAHLSHPNGWWRDTAQQLLVLKQDKSVVPALQQLARDARPNQLARIHALWTLEGLGALDAALVREQMKDADPQIRIQAIRASETLYKAGDRSFAADYRAAAKDRDADVVIQAMLTVEAVQAARPEDGRRVRAGREHGARRAGDRQADPESADDVADAAAADVAAPPPFTPDETAMLERGDKVYKELCFACHGADGRGAPQDGGPAGATMAPSLASSPRVQGHRDYVIKTLLHGMTGPLDGQDLSRRRDDAARARTPTSGSRRSRRTCATASAIAAAFVSAGGRREGARRDRARARRCGRRRSWRRRCRGCWWRNRMEADREPQCGCRRRCAHLYDLEHRRAAAARHVVPGRTAGGCAADRDSVRIARTGRQGWWQR